MIKLIIADQYQSTLDGIYHYMNTVDNVKVIGTADNEKGLMKLAKEKHPDVVILSIIMLQISGVEATRKILMINPQIKVVVFSKIRKQETVNLMIDAGAYGYILKNSTLEVLRKAVQTVYQGKIYFDPQISIIPLRSDKTRVKSKLTRRQLQVLKLIGEGKSSIDIASDLCIGVYTVNTHRKNIARKLNLSGRGALLRYALELKYKS